MEISNLHFEFRIKAKNILKGRVETAKVSYVRQRGGQEGEWGLANKKDEKRHKIYILRVGKELIYIGITKQPLSLRFRQGLTAKGKNGYHGYAWKQLASKDGSKLIELFVYRFRDEKITEAIEAEIVYLIRNKTGKWPKYQTEIHFHQANKKEITITKQIYKQVFTSK